MNSLLIRRSIRSKRWVALDFLSRKQLFRWKQHNYHCGKFFQTFKSLGFWIASTNSINSSSLLLVIASIPDERRLFTSYRTRNEMKLVGFYSKFSVCYNQLLSVAVLFKHLSGPFSAQQISNRNWSEIEFGELPTKSSGSPQWTHSLTWDQTLPTAEKWNSLSNATISMWFCSGSPLPDLSSVRKERRVHLRVGISVGRGWQKVLKTRHSSVENEINHLQNWNSIY